MTEPSWKTSNQTKKYRNVKLEVLDVNDGILDSTQKSQTVSGFEKTTRQISIPTSLGVDTKTYYSKLSLGDNKGIITETGQAAVDINTSASVLYSAESSNIALQEKSDGKNLHGISYIEGVTPKNINPAAPTISAVGIYANDVNTDPDANSCATYVDSQKCLTINSVPRNLPNSTLSLGLAGRPVNPDIKLDVNGSLRVDGFITFIQ